ncbi:hypothetical protein CIG75_07625 [Tumebacillus algifaecis]|uniref:DUF1269 domain-containing protein n=1 Tax=Tumebacillus algifaecis TaxID=1214604 RepID=A0A223CZQ9_9BACL|nr:hypothetical protein [Tumebacillus algifaecis]ASS74860.1 hypothetical protein CIG75_07625 [Tumebacillus algifaecis]
MAQHVFGLFETQEAARSVIGALSPFVSQDKVSAITKSDQLPDYVEKQYETDNVVDGTLIGAGIGAVLGLTAGFASAMYPAAGNLLITLGPLAGAFYGSWSGGVVGGLVDLGISPPHAEHYHDQVANGKILLTAEVSEEHLQTVEQLFQDHGADAVLVR